MDFVLFSPKLNAFVSGFRAPPLEVSYTVCESSAMVFDNFQDVEHTAAFIKNVVVRFKGNEVRKVAPEIPFPEPRWCSLAARAARRPDHARFHLKTDAEMLSEFLLQKGKLP